MNEILKQIDWGEVAVIAGITVVSTGICILCPPATPWVIAGGVAAGALAEGGMEVYKESKTGEYEWVKILTKTLGGGLKGALAASPLKPLATGLGVATTGAIEDYIYCIADGETHEQALKSAAINGPIEGLTVGGCKWLGNALANKVKVKINSESKPTIWNFIKETQASREGTIIPKSFELQAGDYKYWVAPNATKHMHEYSTRHLYATPVDSSISPTQSMTEQALLSSFQGAVEEASKIGYTFEVPIKVGNWELIFSQAREEGLLTVIKHAVYML